MTTIIRHVFELIVTHLAPMYVFILSNSIIKATKNLTGRGVLLTNYFSHNGNVVILFYLNSIGLIHILFSGRTIPCGYY